ncbi:MAG: MarR family winged helix-turn-helix transcriptional regulator [Acidimicrobiales bacterium]
MKQILEHRYQSEPVIDAVISASRALVAVAAASLADVGDEVTLTQYRTLVVLASRGPQRLSDLAEAVGVTSATATRMCDRLIRKKLIHRRTEREDRRNVRITLSSKGHALVDGVTRNRRDRISKIIETISANDQETLINILTAFALAAGEVPDRDWVAGWEL